jgi:hypothetical protein
MSAKKPAPMPTDKAREVDGHSCGECGSKMLTVNGTHKYCRDDHFLAGIYTCPRKNVLMKIGELG